MPSSSGPPLFYSPRFLDHRQLPGHPECPDRLQAIEARLTAEGLWSDVRAPGPASQEQVVRVHEAHYLDRLRVATPGPYDMDTYLSPATYDIALLAAGATVQAAQLAAAEPARPTLALSRPPGHHAGPGYGGGFCYINNVAVAARALQAEQGFERLAIVDIDVHHGNGTAEIFNDDPTVLYCSTHGYPMYPGTGAAEETGNGQGEGCTVNLPLPHGSGDATYQAAMARVLLPVLEQYRPEALLVSLGVDAHYRDPLAGLSLSSTGYADCLERLIGWARERALPCSVTLEGGYDLEATAEVLACCAGTLAGRERGRERGKLQFTRVQDTHGSGLPAVQRAVEIQRAYWEV